MAKKVVASLQKGGGKEHSKVIKCLSQVRLEVLALKRKLYTTIK